MTSPPSVLFVCVHNAGRSQMAQGWLRHIAGDAVEVRSAGSEPGDRINPVAVEAMREVGIDITAEQPKILTVDFVQHADVVITMGCGDTCPIFPGKRYEDWELPDPAGQPIEVVRDVRDQLRARVEILADTLLGMTNSATDFATPRDLVDAFADALNAKDAEQLGRLFTDDAQFVNIMGMRMQERSGIVAGHSWAFAGPLRGSYVEFDSVDNMSVTDDVAILHAHCVRHRQPDAPESTLPPGSSVLVFVARREPRGWRLVAATNVTESAPPAG